LKKSFFLLFLALSSYGYCDAESQEFVVPWLTGPLLTPSAVAIPKGSYEIEPYLYYTIFTGEYDKHWKPHSTSNFYQTNFQLFAWIGITKNADISLMAQAVYNSTENVSDGGIGDPSLTFDLQLLSEDRRSKWRPGIKFSLTEIFPVGSYQQLNPHKKLTDVTGRGSFGTMFSLLFSKIYNLWGHHYLSSVLNISNQVNAPCSVKEFSFYGGDKTTKGTIYRGNTTMILYGMELTLTQNWVFAMDIGAFISAKTRFSGHTKSPTGLPSSTQITLSPAIEYNWSQDVGVIIGTWFTVAGRNSYQFISGVGAVSLYGKF
jgi:hypothetical protein